MEEHRLGCDRRENEREICRLKHDSYEKYIESRFSSMQEAIFLKASTEFVKEKNLREDLKQLRDYVDSKEIKWTAVIGAIASISAIIALVVNFILHKG